MSQPQIESPARQRTARIVFGGATALALVLGGAAGAQLLDSWTAQAQDATPAQQPIEPMAIPALPSFADLVERVTPAVVSVRVEEGEQRSASADGQDDMSREMMRRFFEQFGMPMPEGPQGPREALGSASSSIPPASS